VYLSHQAVCEATTLDFTAHGITVLRMMKKPRSSNELAKQLEHETEDDVFWAQEPVQIAACPSSTSVLSLRLPTAEFHALLKAAREAGESVSEYVRKAIEMRS
jgi:hypothetical protein